MNFGQRALTGIAAYAAVEISLPIINLLASVLIIRTLGKQTYGELALVLSVFSVIALLLDPGVGSWMIAEIARRRGIGDESGAAEMVRSFGLFQLVWGAVLGVGALLIGTLTRPGGIDDPLIWGWLGAYVWVNGWDNAVTTGLHAHTRFVDHANLKILQQASRLIILGILWLVGRLTIHAVVASYAVSMALPLARLLSTWEQLSGQSKIGRHLGWPRGLSGRVGATVAWNALRTVPEVAPLWLLRTFKGLDAVATYQVGFRAFAVIYSLARSVESAVFPLVAEGVGAEVSELSKFLTRAFKILLVTIILAIPGLVLLSDWAVITLFGGSYADSVAVFRFSLLGLITFPLMVTQRSLLFALGRVDILTWATGGATVVYLFALPRLISMYGPVGAAMALLIYTLSIATLSALVMRSAHLSFRLPLGSLLHFDRSDFVLFSRTIRHLSVRLQRWSALWR